MGLKNSSRRLFNEAQFAYVRWVLWQFRSPLYVNLIGGPGAGKGTLGDELTKLTGIPKRSTGDLFRLEIQSGSPLGQSVAPIVNTGGLVADEVTLAVTAEALRRWACRYGVILDGLPRKETQALLYDDLLAGWGQAVDCALFLDCKTSDLVVRTSGRRICDDKPDEVRPPDAPKPCGRIYHVDFNPPKKQGVCDTCGHELIQRPDDAPDVVEDRIVRFNATNGPILEHYEKRGVLYRIKTDNTPGNMDRVLAEALKIVNSRKR